VGGNGLVETSLELRYNLVGDLVLAVFLDAGFVTSTDILSGLRNDSSYFFRNMQYAVGFGLRYLTILGPIRLDIGYRLNVGPPLPIINPSPPVTLPTAQTGCFGFIGHGGGPNGAGAPEGVCALHLSIGEAF
jgi:translocation and assembly module TamA